MFITRYLDLFYDWVSLYNFTMKVFFIASSCYILYLMKYKYRYASPSFPPSSPLSPRTRAPNSLPAGQHTTRR